MRIRSGALCPDADPVQSDYRQHARTGIFNILVTSKAQLPD